MSVAVNNKSLTLEVKKRHFLLFRKMEITPYNAV